jgi:hypothetical protein
MNTQSIIAILLAVTSTITSAQIYKTTDEKGNPQFTDSPYPDAADATPVHLKPINTVPSVDTNEESTQGPAAVETKTSVAYKNLTITSPENDGIIPNGLSPTKVIAAINPALRKGHQLRLLVNGSEAGTSRSNSFIVPTLNRGTNTLQVEVFAGSDTIQSSAIVTIFAYRPGGK